MVSTSVIQLSEIPLLGISTAGFNSHAFLYAFHYVPTIFPFLRALDPNFKEKLFLFCLILSNAICSLKKKKKRLILTSNYFRIYELPLSLQDNVPFFLIIFLTNMTFANYIFLEE